jgi:hypothetical protein
MEEVTLTLDARHADVLRRRVASECGSAGEKLHGAADGYAYVDKDIAAFRAAMADVEVWGHLMDSLGWEPEEDGAGGARTLTAPRGRLRDLLTTALESSVESLDQVRLISYADQRPSKAVQRRVEEIKLFEELLDRVGWPEPDDGGER